MNNIVSLEYPAFPLVREMICIYLVLTECYGSGVGQVRVAYVDREHEQPLFGSAEHFLDFSGSSPLDLVGIIFRLEACKFPRAGLYSVQFWDNHEKVDEKPLRLR